jgi:hypothetical protein
MNPSVTTFVSFLWAITAFATASATGQLKEALTARALIQEIATGGPKQVVDEYWANQGRWNKIMEFIETGDEKWLEVAVRLRAGLDAGTSEELDAAVAGAIPKNPRGVLRLLKNGFTIHDVCVPPFIEAKPEVEARYVGAATHALNQVRDPHLIRLRNHCLQMLNKQVGG